MKTATRAANKETSRVDVHLPQIEIRQIELTLVGDSPLISHAWSDRAKAAMLGKQMGEAKQGKPKKNPELDYKESLYSLPNGGYGFPAVAFKSAAVDACRFVEGVAMTEARGAFHIIGEMVRIEGDPSPREDMVRVGMGTADIRYRAQFVEWKVRLHIRFNGAVLTAAQIANLFNVAGFGVGVGDWRPEKNGSCGMFHVAAENEV